MWFNRLFRRPRAPLYLYNTLTKAKEPFEKLPHTKAVRMYNCGPTVYGMQHIGNLSMFVFTDVLRRALEYNDFPVKQVINFTDFGHLASDADEGEDKMLRGLKRDGLEPTLENMLVMGKKYADLFKRDLSALNVNIEEIIFPFASEYVPAQIAMIETLEEKGYAYRAKSGVYFDTSKFADYGALGSIDLAGQKEGARVAADPDKRNPTDFILWKLNPDIGWESPWGRGFPGWHIECSAMIRSILGSRIDIHTGGIEHIPVHHNNEIAQSEAASAKKPLSRFWLHRAHVQIGGEKIAKSEGNVVHLADIEGRGHHSLALRYLFLTAHYRTPSNFTWEALEAAQTSFLKLRRLVDAESATGTPPSAWQKKIRERLNDDLDTPGALALIWEMAKDRELSGDDIRAAILDADRVLGLGLGAPDEAVNKLIRRLFGAPVGLAELPERVRTLVDSREAARREKDWQHADKLRAELGKLGYVIEDTSAGPRVFKKQ